MRIKFDNKKLNAELDRIPFPLSLLFRNGSKTLCQSQTPQRSKLRRGGEYFSRFASDAAAKIRSLQQDAENARQKS
jgi:hypothetical protein